jgi:hypothetical protein
MQYNAMQYPNFSFSRFGQAQEKFYHQEAISDPVKTCSGRRENINERIMIRDETLSTYNQGTSDLKSTLRKYTPVFMFVTLPRRSEALISELNPCKPDNCSILQGF